MDFELTEFQADLAAGVRRLCEGHSLRRDQGSERAVDRERWRDLAGAGVFELGLGEEAGGLGLGLADAALVFEELGRALVSGPLVPSYLAAGLIDGVHDGSVIVGIVERPKPVTAVIPVIIEHLADLDVLLIIADDGVASVDPSALDATLLRRPMDPLTPVWSAVSLPTGTRVAGPETSIRWRRNGALLTAALQVGIATWSVELAVDHAKQRHQFGRPIGGFQAVKHLCADMVVRSELARAAVHGAAVTVDQPDVGHPMAAVAGAKLLADEAALANGRACIQIHGGMGFTWEVPAHLAYKRARVLATQFGTGDEWAESLAESLGGPVSEPLAESLGGPVSEPLAESLGGPVSEPADGILRR